MVSIAHRTSAPIGRRYFPSIRTILLVRFDPGTRDDVALEIRDEQDPRPYLEARRAASFKKLVGLPPNQAASGAVAFSTDATQLVFDRNINLADAVARVTLKDELSRFVDIPPRRSVRVINGPRIADTLELHIDWKDLPIDSRVIRAILVLHFEGTVTADAFSVGKPELAPDVPNATGFLVPATGQNLRFMGLVDDVSDSHSASGSTLTFKARDLTAPLIDTKVPATVLKVIRPGVSILQVIRDLLDTLKGTAADFIRGPFLRPASAPQPMLTRERYAKTATSAAARNKAARAGGNANVTRRAASGSDDGETYWDAITDLAISHGLVPYIELDKLVLQPPRTLYAGAPEVIGVPAEARFPTAYRKRIGDTRPIRQMIFGSNIEDLAFSRKLARIKAPTVEVTAHNPNALDARKRLITVRYPDKQRASAVDATGKSATGEIHHVLVQGITDPMLLKSVAEAAYESMGRNELGVSFSTSELASYSDHPNFDPNDDPDMLDLRHGDPVQVLVASAGRSAVVSIAEMNLMIARARRSAGQSAPTFDDAITYLTSRGFNLTTARQLVRVLVSANLPTEFRLSQATITFDIDAPGVSLQVELRDYIRVRSDPKDPVSSYANLRTFPPEA